MAKYLYSLSILLLLGTSVQAQSELKIGLKVSPTLSWMHTDDNKIEGSGSLFGVKLGIQAEYYFRENYALIGGLNLALNQGGKLRHDQGGNFWTKSNLDNPLANNNDPLSKPLPDGTVLKYKLQMLEIPFGLKLRTNEFGYIRYFAELPVFTLGFTTRSRGAISNAGMLNLDKQNIKKDVNSIQFGWGLGGGIEYNIGNDTRLVAGVFYQGYLTDFTDNDAYKVEFLTETPTSPEDVKRVAEDSRGSLNIIEFRLGVIF